MVAYNFEKRFVPYIEAGLDPGPWLPGMKRHTLRRERTDGRHARPEQPLQLYTAQRTRQCRKIGNAICRLKMPVLLNLKSGELGILRADGPAPRSYVMQLAPIVREILETPVGRLFSGDAMDEFARTDGFADRRDMASYFDAPENGRACHLSMILIAWAPIQ